MASVRLEEDYRPRIYERYASGFQNAGPCFDAAAAARWGSAYAHYLRNWLPASSGAAIVDLASGGGRLLHFLRARGYSSVTGVDVSPEQAALCRQVTDSVFEEDVREFLGRHGDSFDLITGLDLIEHFRKSEVLPFLDACHGALRAGGRLVLQTPNADSPWSSSVRYGDFTHEVAFNPTVLARLLNLCGFTSVEYREVGPVLLRGGAASFLRGLAWKSIRAAMAAWNLVETGDAGSGVLTRVFLISALKA